MRKLILIIVALVLGAAVGLSSSELWRRARTLPYCKVANNAESYHMKYVRVKAKVHFRTGGMYIYEDCDPVEALAASLDLKGGPTASGDNYVSEMLLPEESSTGKVADAIVEGEFDAHASTGCWAPKFRIAVQKIQLTSRITDWVPPASDVDGTSVRVKH